MKVIKATGLVPLRFAGEPPMLAVRGLLPEFAAKLLAEEAKRKATDPKYVAEVSLVDIADDIETEDYEAPVAAAAPVAPEEDVLAKVEIPDDWRDKKPATLVKLAQSFNADIKTIEAAKDAIQAELDRRAASQNP